MRCVPSGATARSHLLPSAPRESGPLACESLSGTLQRRVPGAVLTPLPSRRAASVHAARDTGLCPADRWPPAPLHLPNPVMVPIQKRPLSHFTVAGSSQPIRGSPQGPGRARGQAGSGAGRSELSPVS